MQACFTCGKPGKFYDIGGDAYCSDECYHAARYVAYYHSMEDELL